MSQKAFFKDLRRSIFNTKARFLSIMAIIALGVGFFAGINATEPDMIISADKYYQEHNLSDFHLVSPLGFKESDIQSVLDTDGIAQVQAGYSKDVFVTSDAGSTATVRLYSHDSRNTAENGSINVPVLTEGRMPEIPGEIAVEAGRNVPDSIEIGSRITLSLPEGDILSDYLNQSTYLVVGRINSPLYIDFERGMTNIGDGSIGFYAYIPQTDFTIEKATDLFIRTTESKTLTAYSTAYNSHLTVLQDHFEILGQTAIASDTQLLRDELNIKKEELQTSKQDAESELAAGEQKLQDAAQAILDGEQEIKEKEAKYTKELASRDAQLAQGRIDLAQGWELYNTNYALWQSNYDLSQAGLAELAAAKIQLDKIPPQIAAAQAELKASKSQLDTVKLQLDALQTSIDELNKIETDLPTIVPGMTEDTFNQLIADTRVYSGELADNIQANFLYNDPDLLAGLTQLFDAAISQMEITYTQSKSDYDAGLDQYTSGAEQLAVQKTQYQQGLSDYQDSLATLESAAAQLEIGKIELDQAKLTLDQSEAEILAGEAALADGKIELEQQLADGRAKLVDARIELADGRKTYEEEKADALAKIADAETKIKDASRSIMEIPDHWFVMNRDSNPGYSGYGNDAERIGAVAKVFPLFFFLVAALVCLTTMTRMVEEERVQIGTLKALGYSTGKISSKYLVYALLASLIGAASGLIIGFRLFPEVIMNAYGMMYQIPVQLTPYHLNYTIISILIAVVTTVSASLLATLQELRSSPAVLMQPKAPKPGKRILLERIRPLWKRLSFSHKVTARNIFRYKRRFLMTVIGIAGCTALLVTGFGLRDSVNAIMGKQFKDIFIYDGMMMIDTDKSAADLDIALILGADTAVKSYLNAQNETINVMSAGSSHEFEATMVVPEDTNIFPEFYDLHVRTTGEKLNLPDDGAVITEKLAELLHIQVGDTISWRDSEQRSYKVQISSIAENYLMHYIYLSPTYFDKITLRAPVYNTALFNFNNEAALDEKVFKENLLSNDGVLGAMFTSGIADDFNNSIKSLNYVVLLLIISAGALAFVVLYNLTNINITERIREIATIKVLGFRDKEVSAYVYRENILLTVIGTLVGLLTGFVLHHFVMSTMEIDTMMFGKNIALLSYLLSIALTMAFTILVNFFMYYHLRKVNMVESLKSVE